MAITLSDGRTYTTRQPTLSGWRQIMRSVPEEQMRRFGDLLISISSGDDKDVSGDLAKLFGAGVGLSALVSDALGLGAAIAATTLVLANDEGGKKQAMTATEAEETLTAEDLDDVISELQATGTISKVWNRLKNRMGGMRG